MLFRLHGVISNMASLGGVLKDGDRLKFEPRHISWFDWDAATGSLTLNIFTKSATTAAAQNEVQPVKPLKISFADHPFDAVVLESLLNCRWMQVVDLKRGRAVVNLSQIDCPRIDVAFKATFSARVLEADKPVSEARSDIMILILACGDLKDEFRASVESTPGYLHGLDPVVQNRKRARSLAHRSFVDLPQSVLECSLLRYLTRIEYAQLKVTSKSVFELLEPFCFELQTLLTEEQKRAMLWMERNEQYSRYRTFLSGQIDTRQVLIREVSSVSGVLRVPDALTGHERGSNNKTWTFSWYESCFHSRKLPSPKRKASTGFLLPSMKHELDMSVIALILKTFGRNDLWWGRKRSVRHAWSQLREDKKKSYFDILISDLSVEVASWSAEDRRIGEEILRPCGGRWRFGVSSRIEKNLGTLHRFVQDRCSHLSLTAKRHSRSRLSRVKGMVIERSCRFFSELQARLSNEDSVDHASINRAPIFTSSTLILTTELYCRKLKRLLRKHAYTKEVRKKKIAEVAGSLRNACSLARSRQPVPLIIVAVTESTCVSAEDDSLPFLQWTRVCVLGLNATFTRRMMAHVFSDWKWTVLRLGGESEVDRNALLKEGGFVWFRKLGSRSSSSVDKALAKFRSECFLQRTLYVHKRSSTEAS